MNKDNFTGLLNSPGAAETLKSLYGESGLDFERRRFLSLFDGLPEAQAELRVFSVPGRTELGGNHTDHNLGKVLAASIQLDAAALAAHRRDMQVLFRSTGHPDVKVDLNDLSPIETERGKTEALVRGIAAEFAARGTAAGGFSANADNRVLTGSGLSSSAALEVLIAKIFDCLYCGGQKSSLELAKIGQRAENLYFGKPCGLMDQIACASGGAAAIDFASDPLVKTISFDPEAAGFALCIVNTGGSHSDLTPDYAAIPAEMKAVASFFGKSALRELDEKTLMAKIAELRKASGDRAVLRALHFLSENRRVDAMLSVLEDMNSRQANEKKKAMETFLYLVNDSGDSSLEQLQNIYSVKNPGEQGIGLALALTKKFLKDLSANEPGAKLQGACRVHGGGFAGTIQAYIPLKKLDDYRNFIENVFGKEALTVLKIRQQGALELHF
jgi:galactokinase